MRHFVIAWMVLAICLTITGSRYCAAQTSCSYSFSPQAVTVAPDATYGPSFGSTSFTVVASAPTCTYTLMAGTNATDFNFSLSNLNLQPGTHSYTIATQLEGGPVQEALIVGTFGPQSLGVFPTLTGPIAILPVTNPGYNNTSSLRATTTVLPDSINGQLYAPLQLQASGGMPPYTWFNRYSNTPLVVDSAGNVTNNSAFVDPTSFTQTYPILFALSLNLQDAAGTVDEVTVFFTNYPSSAQLCTNAGYGGDADDDGLCDDWETNGIRDAKGNMLVDLHAMGADPKHKDIFVQADYMKCDPSAGCQTDAHTHRPGSQVLSDLIMAFAKAPVGNPGADSGIALHIDCGPDCPMSPGKTWGALSLSSEINENATYAALGSVDNFKKYQWAAVDTLKANFLKAGRQQAFHYMVYAHTIAGQPYLSGLSRGIPQSDFIVALGSFLGLTGTDFMQKSTFMHELGHNLALHHGGNEDTNFKPNYLSVMNYLFQGTGLIGGPSSLDYSQFLLPSLNKAALDDTVGLNGGSVLSSYGTAYFCPGKVPTLSADGSTNSKSVTPANGIIDWKCDQDISTSVQANIDAACALDANGHPILPCPVDVNGHSQNPYPEVILPGYNDWSNLVYAGGSIGAKGIDYLPPATSQLDEPLPLSNDVVIQSPISVYVSCTGYVHVPVGTTSAVSCLVKNIGLNSGIFSIGTASTLPWADFSGLPATLPLASGASTQLNFSVTVPAGTAPGTTNFVDITATPLSDPGAENGGLIEFVALNSSAPGVASPSFTPAAGTFTAAQNVSIADATAGASIYYTTDGTTPSASSNLYSSPITVSSTETIQAIAVASGYTNSAAVSATYTINIPVVPTAATPTFTPAAGTFTEAQSVTISDATAGASIYYTTDGTTPTTSSTLYSGPIAVSNTETIQAVAIASGYTNSAVASAAYTINIPVVSTAATPTFTPATGTFTAAQSVTISDATAGAAIYYTTDGAVPTASSTLYSGPITVSSTETIQAIAIATGYTNSAVATATYTINLPQDFTLGLSAATLAITAGQSGTLTASVSPINGYSQPVSFTCSGLPAGDSCSFSPSTVTGSGATTVTVTTAVSTSFLTGNRPFELAGLLAGLSLLLAGRRFRRLGRIGVLMMMAVGIGGAISGCGGGSATSTSSPEPTTSTVTINAASGSLTHTSTFSLTVK